MSDIVSFSVVLCASALSLERVKKATSVLTAWYAYPGSTRACSTEEKSQTTLKKHVEKQSFTFPIFHHFELGKKFSLGATTFTAH